jgi:Cu/Ag efflux protein CusF
MEAMEIIEQPKPKKRTLTEIIDDLRKVLHSIDDLEGEVTPELEEELTACEVSLADKVDRCLWVAREAEAQAGVWAERAKTFADRAKVLKNQAARLEDYVLGAMITVSIDKLCTTNFTAAVQKSPDSVAVDNEEKFIDSRIDDGMRDVPDAVLLNHQLIDLNNLPKFVRVKLEVDKKALLAALKEGDKTIQFARLVTDKVHLRVR